MSREKGRLFRSCVDLVTLQVSLALLTHVRFSKGVCHPSTGFTSGSTQPCRSSIGFALTERGTLVAVVYIFGTAVGWEWVLQAYCSAIFILA